MTALSSPLTGRSMIFASQRDHPENWKNAIVACRTLMANDVSRSKAIENLLKQIFPQLHDSNAARAMQVYLTSKTHPKFDAWLKKIELGRMLSTEEKLQKIKNERDRLREQIRNQPIKTCSSNCLFGRLAQLQAATEVEIKAHESYVQSLDEQRVYLPTRFPETDAKQS